MGALSTLTVTQEYQPFVNSGQGDSSLPQQNRAGNGYARYLPTAATELADTPTGGVAISAEARHAWIVVKDYPIRMRTDGTVPTATEGLYIPAGTMIQVENQRQFLTNLSFINTAAGASEVTIMYFA